MDTKHTPTDIPSDSDLLTRLGDALRLQTYEQLANAGGISERTLRRCVASQSIHSRIARRGIMTALGIGGAS